MKHASGAIEGLRSFHIAKFWRKVPDRSDPNACWIWAGARTGKGYGVIGLRCIEYTAHRVSYAIAHGVCPAGLMVLHSCDNPPCVNPGHLRLGTHADNMKDMVERGRHRHAKTGKAA